MALLDYEGERERERGEAERVSERDAAPSSTCFGLTRRGGTSVRTPSGSRGLWPVSHDGCCPTRFRRVKEPTDRVTSCTCNS